MGSAWVEAERGRSPLRDFLEQWYAQPRDRLFPASWGPTAGAIEAEIHRKAKADEILAAIRDMTPDQRRQLAALMDPDCPHGRSPFLWMPDGKGGHSAPLFPPPGADRISAGVCP